MRQQVVVKRPPEEVHGEEMAELAERDAASQEHSSAELLEESDRLLEEIEEALGESVMHAQEFVQSYIQQGGQ